MLMIGEEKNDGKNLYNFVMKVFFLLYEEWIWGCCFF